MFYKLIGGINHLIILPHYYFPAFYLTLIGSMIIVCTFKNRLTKYKFYFILLLTLFINLALLILAIHFAPISKDVGACGSGFNRYIVDTNIDKLSEEFIKYKDISDKKDLAVISSPDKTAGDINYKGRYIYLSVKYRVGEKAYLVYFMGKRYWIEMFTWQVNNVSEVK